MITRRDGFTLTELLVVIAIIALLSGASLFAMHGVMDDVKVDRTTSQIERINRFIEERWEEYHSRTVAIRIPPMTDPRTAAATRLAGLRELMRMELPDRITDLEDAPVILSSQPTLWRSYQRRATALLNARHGNGSWTNWTVEFQGAECLYLILSSTNEDGNNAASDHFSATEIGDVDDDGMPEILDAWGKPIQFIRWPAGFLSARQSRDPAADPDPFDPLKVDPRWTAAAPNLQPFMLFPLIFSAGSDGTYEIVMNDYDPRVATPPPIPVNYSQTASPPYNSPVTNDPYMILPTATPQLQYKAFVGMPFQTSSGYADNIHNHMLEVK